MEIRELLAEVMSNLHMGRGDPNVMAMQDSAPFGEAAEINAAVSGEENYGPLVSQESLQQEFIDREHSRLHPDVSRAALLSEPTLDSVEGELLREYRSTLAELFGNPEELSEEDNFIDQLEAEFTGIPTDEPKPFVPMWSPVDRERLTQAFENGGIDAVNEAFPGYNGLEMPSGDGRWRKDRDLIEQLIPPEQIPAMESHNRLAYLNMLRNAADKGEGVPMHGVRSYREGMGPFMRTGENSFDSPLREKHELAGQHGANYIMGNGVPTMQEMAAGSNSPSVTGLMYYMDYFPALTKYNSQIRDQGSTNAFSPFGIPGDELLSPGGADAAISSLVKAAGQSYQNQSNKVMFPYNEAIGTSQNQTGSYYERYKEYEKNAKAFAESQPPGGVQQAHGSLEGVLGADKSKELMEGPNGAAIGFGFDMASEIADFSPFGAFGEGMMNAGQGMAEASARVMPTALTGRRIALLKQAARGALPEIAGEAVFDGGINATASSVNLGSYGAPPAQKVEDPGVVGQRIQKNLDHMNTLTPLPQDKGITHLWNEEDNHLREEMNRRRGDGFPVDSLMKQSSAGNGAYNADLWRSAQQNRQKSLEAPERGPMKASPLFGF